jgi:hypothetical protein
MTALYDFQLNQLQRGLPQWAAPQWIANPVITAISVGSPVAVSGGTVAGIPTPTVSFQVSIDGISKVWPYTLQPGDAGRTLQVIPVATSAAGIAYGSILSAVPTTAIPPGQVVGLSISGLTSSGLTLNWADPISGGTVANYVVGYRVAGTGTWTTQSVGTAGTCTLSGLTSPTNYEIEVYGTNAAGNGTVALTSVQTPANVAGYWPSGFQLGMNVAQDQNYYANPAFADRTLVFGTNTFRATDGTFLQTTDFDPTTNYPNKSFKFTAVGFTEARSQGNWTHKYVATQQLSVASSSTAGNVVSSVWDSGTGVGRIVFNNTYANAFSFIVTVPAGTQITSYGCYPPFVDPDATSIFVPQWLTTLAPYAYLRFMDWATTNSDYFLDTVLKDWQEVVEWSDRITPATVRLNSRVGNSYYQRGYPLEWQIQACNLTNKDGWFHITMNASDDCVTQFATFVANNLAAGRKAVIQPANEAWNYGLRGGYYKCERSAWLQVGAFTMYKADGSGNPHKNYFTYTSSVSSISCDGSRVTLNFTNPHGITGNTDGVSGNYVWIAGMAAAYAAYVPVANTVYRVDSTTSVSYPVSKCAVPASAIAMSAVTSDTFLASNTGFVALKMGSSTAGGGTNVPQTDVRNAGINVGCAMLANGSTLSLYMYGQYYTLREYDVNKLIKAAFAAAGRAGDVLTLMSINPGTPASVFFGNERLLAASGRTTPINQVYDAINTSKYLGLSEGNTAYGTSTVGFYNPVLGASGIGNASTPSATLVSNAQNQLRAVCDTAYGQYSLASQAAYAKYRGLQVFIYETGVDTSGFTATSDMSAVNTIDTGVTATSIKSMCTEWLWALQDAGVARAGWFHNGCLANQANTGCFDIGVTADSIDPTKPSAGWAPKFAGVMASMTPPALITARPKSVTGVTNHTFPCTLSGYDYVGNEAVYVNPTNWPNLSTTYDASSAVFNGPNKNGKTYKVRCEADTTVTLTVTGHCTYGSAVSLSVEVLGVEVAATQLTAPASGGSKTSPVSFGTVTLHLKAGVNWLFISSPVVAAAASVFLHSVSVQ